MAVQAKFYSHGPHGFGLANGVAGAPNLPDIAGWPALCAAWMGDRGFLSPVALARPAPPRPAVPSSVPAYDFLGRLVPAPGVTPSLPPAR